MTMLHDRFELVRELGRGSQGVTHLAIDHETGEEVAIKELDFRRVSDWKAHELFEREGEALRSLDHPSIPRYVDAFAVEEEDQIRIFLAQEYVRGETLEEELDRGKRWTEDELVEDAAALLGALEYLHGLTPPVVHRDIKPSNVIRRDDGRLALIDFGAVQNALPRTVGGSTVIGTPGYMAIEQLMGRAVPATDIYALGATLIHLFTRVEPSKLPVERNRLQFREHATSLSPRFCAVLEKMTEPSAEDRPQTADRVRQALTASHEVSAPAPDVAPNPDFDVSSLPVETSRFPGWAAVKMNESDEFMLTFEMRDRDERMWEARLDDDVNETKLRLSRTPKQRSTPVLGLMLAIGMLLIPMLPIVPAVITVLAVVGFAWAARGEASHRVREITVDQDGLRLSLDGQTTVDVPRASIAGVEVKNDALLVHQAGAPSLEVLTMSPAERFRWSWLERHFSDALATDEDDVVMTNVKQPRTDDDFWRETPQEVAAKREG